MDEHRKGVLLFRSKDVFHIRAYVPRDKTEKLILALHEQGICELKEAEAELERHEPHREPREIEEIQARLALLIEELNHYREVMQPENLIRGFFFPKAPQRGKVDLLSNEKVFAEVDKFLTEAEPQVLPKLARAREIGEGVTGNAETIGKLKIMPGTSTSLFRPTENIRVSLGIVMAKAAEKIRGALPEGAVLGVGEIDAKRSLIAVFSAQEMGQEVERLLHEHGFEPLDVPFEDKTPQEITAELEARNRELSAELKGLEEELRAAWKEFHGRLELLEEETGVVKERNSALGMLKAGRGFAVMDAWVPGTEMERFRRTAERVAGRFCMEAEEREDAPTIFSNPRPIRQFEMITALYGVPKYKALDPTPLLAISFALFFGFMLTDFAYGLLYMLIGYAIFRGIGKYNPGMRQFSAILMTVGLSTMVLGVAFGSYFGNILQKFGISMPMLLDPIQQVIIVIAISLIIGVTHLGAGLVMGYYENVRCGKIRDAFANQGVWLFFVVGVILALLDGGVFRLLGMALIGAAVLMLVAFKFMEAGPIVALLSVFNFSGFVGDVFSYARLTALAVGTSGMALAVNFMALLVAGMIPVLGIPIAVVIFVIGHLFIMTMNGLGGFVHSLRLHFLEHFSKYYEGGGRLYKPFYAMRTKNYMEVEEW